VSQIGAGTTILTGANTYAGGTTISAGTLQLGAGGTSGGIVGDVADNGALAFDRSDTVTFAGTISGSGAVNQIGAGTTILTADNTYTGPTTIAAGTLQLGNGGASGVVVGDIIDNAVLVFDRSDTVTIPGTISGAGTVSQIGGGTTILTADNSYTGGTTISAGTLQLGNGGTSGSIVGDVADNGALVFDRSDTVTFAGAISGAGTVNQIGAGATILNATNPYSGPTTISAGTLVVGDASHPGASIGVGTVEIAAVGKLGGFGSVGGSVVNDGAIVVGNALPAFAAGPLATFQIGGDLVNSGAVMLGSPAIGNVLAIRGNYFGQGGTVEMSTLLNEGGPLANQTTDRLLVYGNASGATQVRVNGTGAGAFTGTGQPNASDGISLIQVAGAASSGTFQLAGGYVTGGTPYQYRLYAFGPGSAIGPADPSQSLVGNPSGHWDYRLENVYVDPTGPVPPIPVPPHDERLELAPQVPAYLTTPLAVFNAGMQDLDSLHRRLGEIRDDQQLGRGQPGDVFARVYGGTYDYTSNLSFQNYGYNVDQDYVALQFGANWIAHQDNAQTVRVGLAGTLGRLWFKPDAIDGESTGLMNTETLAGIATLQRKSGWYIDAILAGSLFDGNVSTADRGRTTKLDGSRFETSIEGGYPIALGRPGLAFEPQVQFVYQRLYFDNKTDVDGIDVAIGAPDQAMARIGARLTQQIVAGQGTLITPYLKMNYLQGIGGGDHEEIGGVVFGTGGYGQAFQVGGGATGTLGKSFSVYGDVAYQTHVGSGGFGGWSFNGGLRYVF
jgi:outer membrane autotransporter protein